MTVSLQHNHMASWNRNFHVRQRLAIFALHDVKSPLSVMFYTWLKNISISCIILDLNNLNVFITVYYCLFIYYCIQAFTQSFMWHKMIINDLSEYIGALSRFELPPVVTLWLWPLGRYPPQWYYCALLEWLSQIFHWYDRHVVFSRVGLIFKLEKLFFFPWWYTFWALKLILKLSYTDYTERAVSCPTAVVHSFHVFSWRYTRIFKIANCKYLHGESPTVILWRLL